METEQLHNIAKPVSGELNNNPWGFNRGGDTATQKLAERGITPELNAKLKIVHLGLEETSRKYLAPDECLEIPYFNIDGQPVIEADGRPYAHARMLNITKGKYRSQRGDRPHAYLPPLVDWRDIANKPQMALALTEGEWKAIDNLGNVPTIGLAGITMLRDGNQLVAELRPFNWKNRDVFIAFDAPRTDEITRAEFDAYCLLKSKGANPKVLSIEDTPVYAGGKMGLDDYRKAGGTWLQLKGCEFDIEAAYGVEAHADLAWMLSNVAYFRGGKGNQYLVLDSTFRHPKGVPVRTFDGIKADYAPLTYTPNGTKRPVPIFNLWAQHRRRLVCDGLTFNPAKPEWSLYAEHGCTYFNDWRGLAVSPRRNTEIANVVRAFVRSMFSSWDREAGAVIQSDEQALLEKWFWNFFANMFQHPERRPTHSWVINSDQQGIGKSVSVEMAIAIIGAPGAGVISPDDLFDKFTDALYGKWYVVANEPSSTYERHSALMKNLRTDAELTMNLKFGAKFQVPNCLVVNSTTNKQFAYGMDATSRRDIVYSPSWLSSSVFGALPDGPEKAAHAAHLELAKEVGKRLGATATGPERREWAAAFLAMLLDHKIEGYSHTADAPLSAGKNVMAEASMSKNELVWAEIEQDLDALVVARGGFSFSAESWVEWLKRGQHDIAPVIAKQRLHSTYIAKQDALASFGFGGRDAAGKRLDDGRIRAESLLGNIAGEQIYVRLFGAVKAGWTDSKTKCGVYVPSSAEQAAYLAKWHKGAPRKF